MTTVQVAALPTNATGDPSQVSLTSVNPDGVMLVVTVAEVAAVSPFGICVTTTVKVCCLFTGLVAFSGLIVMFASGWLLLKVQVTVCPAARLMLDGVLPVPSQVALVRSQLVTGVS